MKSLLTGHVAMLPFLFANTGLLWLIGRKIAGDTWGVWLPLLVLADPVLLGQSVMISPDIVVTTGFLLSVYAVLANRKILLSLGVLYVMCHKHARHDDSSCDWRMGHFFIPKTNV
ncbi:MAG: hypothetical protein R2778_12890 [Saprospiraceae bacterium]